MPMRVRPGKFLMRNAMRGVYKPNSITPKAAFLTSNFDLYGRVDLPGGWAAGGQTYSYGTTLRPFGPSDHVYMATVDGGTTDVVTEPVWPDDGTSIADGTQIWQDLGDFPPYDQQEFGDCEFAIGEDNWAATTAYSVGDIIDPPVLVGWRWVCTTAGTSGGSEPTWTVTEGVTTADGTAVWIATGYNPGGYAISAQGDYPLAGRDVSMSFDCVTSADWFLKVPNVAMGTNLTEPDVKYVAVYQPGLVVDDFGVNRINPIYFFVDVDDALSNAVLANDSPLLKFADPIDACTSTDNVAFQIEFFSGF